DDKAEFDQCNFWGDPHYTATWGSDPRFDYQGQGAHDIIFNNLCQLFHMHAFHCQYKSSRNAVTIGIKIQLPLPGTDPANPDFGYVFITKEKVTVSDTALFELVTGVPSWSDVDGLPGGEQEGTLSELQLKSGVGIQTEDGCNYVLINGKYISGKPGFILNVK
ncbi:SLC38A6, partial [Symbiodinium sp. CCMP2456]